MLFGICPQILPNVCSQDFFRARLIPADTDFRMFSQDYEGSLPGIDVATVLDATAYHTNRDTLERIRRGTTQVCCFSSVAMSGQK